MNAIATPAPADVPYVSAIATVALLARVTSACELRVEAAKANPPVLMGAGGTNPTLGRRDEVLSTFGGVGVDPFTGNTADERGLVENFWWKTLGSDYLAKVFQLAHAADPSAKLFLNESLVGVAPTKAQELYDIVADLVHRGIPINGVGLEMHETYVGPPAGVITNIVNSYKSLGLDVAITEMDVHLAPLPNNGEYQNQAQIYGQVINEALAAGIRDISFWGFTDAHTFTWVPGAKPHIFDANYNPKPAYFAVWGALHKLGVVPPG